MNTKKYLGKSLVASFLMVINIEHNDKHYCTFHLPLEAKENWDKERIKPFHEDVFKYIRIVKKVLDLNGVVFIGDVDFSKIEIPYSEIDFSNAQFSGGYVGFSDSTFELADVSFRNVQFGVGNVDFIGARFNRNVDFGIKRGRTNHIPSRIGLHSKN